MRTILFKAKPASGGVDWVYGGYYSSMSIHYIVDSHGVHWTIDPETLCESTGETLQGQPLFENDVVEMSQVVPKFLWVRFIEGAFCLCAVEEIVSKDTGGVSFERGEFVMDLHYIHHAGKEHGNRIVGTIFDWRKP